MELQTRWVEFCKKVGIASTFADSEFVTLRHMYGGRPYHNLDHIQNCLVEFDSCSHLSINPDALEFAIWYHDIIYNTKRQDNEEKSAQYAKAICDQAGVPEKFGSEVSRLIILTNHRQIPTDIDGKLIVDIDLAILGASPEDFEECERAIREEYAHYSESTFKHGRSAILDMINKREDIYETEFFRKKYEKQARENIRSSLERLAA